MDTLERPVVVPVRRRGGRLTLLAGSLAALIVLGAAVHLTQGTASLGPWDVLRILFGAETGDATAVLL
ncbi:hypothetical protein QDK53_41875, partial [Amycolatopsis magusensis]|nr:hypothetical protein [Amycolatopsis magusensis]